MYAASCTMHTESCNVNMQDATCNMQHATHLQFSKQATCDMRQASCITHASHMRHACIIHSCIVHESHMHHLTPSYDILHRRIRFATSHTIFVIHRSEAEADAVRDIAYNKCQLPSGTRPSAFFKKVLDHYLCFAGVRSRTPSGSCVCEPTKTHGNMMVHNF